MKLKPLYRIRFDYPQSWSVEVAGEAGKEVHLLLFAEGRAEHGLVGRFRGANAPRKRTDGPFETEFHGVIEADDGAVILVEYQEFGRAYREPYKTQSPNRRQWVATAKHLSADPRYVYLNDTVCVGTGEVRPKPEGATASNPTELVLDVAELVWEPTPD